MSVMASSLHALLESECGSPTERVKIANFAYRKVLLIVGGILVTYRNVRILLLVSRTLST